VVFKLDLHCIGWLRVYSKPLWRISTWLSNYKR